jgi:hypothetical protein
MPLNAADSGGLVAGEFGWMKDGDRPENWHDVTAVCSICVEITSLVLSVWRTALLAQRKHRRSRALPADRVTVDQQQWSCNKMSAFFPHCLCSSFRY